MSVVVSEMVLDVPVIQWKFSWFGHYFMAVSWRSITFVAYSEKNGALRGVDAGIEPISEESSPQK